MMEHVGHFVAQCVDDRPPKGMGVMELHDPFALPPAVRWWSRIAVHHGDAVTTTGQRDRTE